MAKMKIKVKERKTMNRTEWNKYEKGGRMERKKKH